jgi:hypothetical protein
MAPSRPTRAVSLRSGGDASDECDSRNGRRDDRVSPRDGPSGRGAGQRRNDADPRIFSRRNSVDDCGDDAANASRVRNDDPGDLALRRSWWRAVRSWQLPRR